MEWMKPRIKSRNIRKKKTFKEKRIQKYKDRLRSPWDDFKRTNIQIIGMPEGEDEKQEIENLFEKIMKENLPNLVKEIDIQIQEAENPKQMDPKRTTPRHIIIKMPKVKNKDRILKTSREKQRVIYKEVPIRPSADFSKETVPACPGWCGSVD